MCHLHPLVLCKFLIRLKTILSSTAQGNLSLAHFKRKRICLSLSAGFGFAFAYEKPTSWRQLRMVLLDTFISESTNLAFICDIVNWRFLKQMAFQHLSSRFDVVLGRPVRCLLHILPVFLYFAHNFTIADWEHPISLATFLVDFPSFTFPIMRFLMAFESSFVGAILPHISRSEMTAIRISVFIPVRICIISNWSSCHFGLCCDWVHTYFLCFDFCFTSNSFMNCYFVWNFCYITCLYVSFPNKVILVDFIILLCFQIKFLSIVIIIIILWWFNTLCHWLYINITLKVCIVVVKILIQKLYTL